ncbi:MAG: hypothetical protein HKN45_08805, partial [Flavobacteriales bacterium]|nr:hypothetical protein [Flavobacteriales bacterium]
PRGEWNTIQDLAKANFIHTASCRFRNGLELPDWFLTTSAADYPLHMLNAARGDIHYSYEMMAVYRDHQGGIWSSLQREEILRRWIHLLLTIQPHFEKNVKDVLNYQIKTLMGQLLKETHVPIKHMDKDWFEKLIRGFEGSEEDELKSKLIQYVLQSPSFNGVMDVNYLSKTVKTKTLIKALFRKARS